jgi:hypothetical protein
MLKYLVEVIRSSIFLWRTAINLRFSPQESNIQAESSSGNDMNGHSGSNNTKTTHVSVSHSRNSSDSSGYHEASVLSESPAEGNQMTEKYVYYLLRYCLMSERIQKTTNMTACYNFLQLITPIGQLCKLVA